MLIMRHKTLDGPCILMAIIPSFYGGPDNVSQTAIQFEFTLGTTDFRKKSIANLLLRQI